MAIRPKGRPKQFHGPIVGVKLPAMVSVHLQATAKVRGQTVSQVVRDILRESMVKEWGPER